MRSVSEANRQKQEKKQRNLAQAGRQVRIAGAFLLLIMLLLLSLIWSICSGSVSVPIMEFLQELREPKLRGMAWTIIWEIRLPRALAAMLSGAALSAAGRWHCQGICYRPFSTIRSRVPLCWEFLPVQNFWWHL